MISHNFVVLLGRLHSLKKTNDNKYRLLVKSNSEFGDFVIPVYTSFDFNDSLSSQLEEGTLLGIKGFISLDDDNNPIIVANKLTFLSSKKKGR